MLGSRVGNWLLEAELGRGTFGAVYRARALEIREGEPATAAVKVLDAAISREPAFQERFPGEMLALRRLTHPNIARYYDAGVHAGIVYYAAELVPGRDLAAILAEAPQGLGWAAVHRIVLQAARALKHAHHRSILHRELKPANLILCDDGTLKVTGFGVAKVLNVPAMSLPPAAMGAICFLAPEHFTGKPITRRSDLYSLGAVLYALVCGQPPFRAGTAAEFMHKHCYMLPDRPINFVPNLPPDVDELICTLISKDPSRRPASAAALLDDLDRLRGRLERRGERVLPPPDVEDPTGTHAPLAPQSTLVAVKDPPRQRSRANVLQVALLLGMLAIVIGLILYAFFRPRPGAEELWNAAQPLLASDNPADWDRARDEYLEPLERWHPEAFRDELAAAKQRLADQREIVRALRAAENIEAGSEAERLYRRGLALAQNGEMIQARSVWQALAAVYAHSPADQRWVRLAEFGVRFADARSSKSPDAEPQLLAELRRILDEVKNLRAEGKNDAADSIISSLRSLYELRPDILELLKQ